MSEVRIYLSTTFYDLKRLLGQFIITALKVLENVFLENEYQVLQYMAIITKSNS